MAARTATARSPQKAQRELEDLQLVLKARNGDSAAMDALIRRYTGFVRLKASSYFLAGGDNDDLLQEGLIGLYKAVRDFRADKETSFRSFDELCVTRQIIRAIKTATRFKHTPLNTYISFSHTPAGQDGDGECTLGDALPGPAVHEPPLVVISTEELQSLVFSLGAGLSPLEADALRLYLEGASYEDMAEHLGCDTKTIDNALQRVKRKILAHQKGREVLLWRPLPCARRAGVAQLVEQRPCKAWVVGSSPTSGSFFRSLSRVVRRARVAARPKGAPCARSRSRPRGGSRVHAPRSRARSRRRSATRAPRREAASTPRPHRGQASRCPSRPRRVTAAPRVRLPRGRCRRCRPLRSDRRARAGARGRRGRTRRLPRRGCGTAAAATPPASGLPMRTPAP